MRSCSCPLMRGLALVSSRLSETRNRASSRVWLVFRGSPRRKSRARSRTSPRVGARGSRGFFFRIQFLCALGYRTLCSTTPPPYVSITLRIGVAGLPLLLPARRSARGRHWRSRESRVSTGPCSCASVFSPSIGLGGWMRVRRRTCEVGTYFQCWISTARAKARLYY